MKLPAATLTILLVSAAGAAAQSRTTPQACAALQTLQVAGIALEVTKTEWVPAATLPAYCRLDGMLDRRVGAQGVRYGIGFALALPEQWNGRFLFQGGGGLNGSVQPPLGGSAAGGLPALARGFAVVSTDTAQSSSRHEPIVDWNASKKT